MRPCAKAEQSLEQALGEMTRGRGAPNAPRPVGFESAGAERACPEERDGVPTFWLSSDELARALERLATRTADNGVMLTDLFRLDDALGADRATTLVYAFSSLATSARLRLKVRVGDGQPQLPSATPLFPNAAWYEREIAASAGVTFRGNPNLAPLPSEVRAQGLTDDDPLDVDVTLPRVLAIEELLDIDVPPRAEAIRVLRCELLRAASHLFWYGAFIEAVGAVAPAFYASADARRVLEVAHALGGTHPERFLVGGVKQDLAPSWRGGLEMFLDEMQMRARDYSERVLSTPTLQAATKGVSPMSAEEAVSWGITGPILRSTGMSYDVRKVRPYCGYERYDFDVPTGVHGDLYDRARVRLEELRQSLRILEQCVSLMPEGDVITAAPSALPPGEATAEVEGSVGVVACYVASNGGSLFVHHRAPSFCQLQAVESMAAGCDDPAAATLVTRVDLAPRPAR